MDGILAVLAKKVSKTGKGATPEPDEETDEPKPDGDESGVGKYTREAFGALKSDDEDGFVTAFKGAVRACMSSYGEK